MPFNHPLSGIHPLGPSSCTKASAEPGTPPHSPEAGVAPRELEVQPSHSEVQTALTPERMRLRNTTQLFSQCCGVYTA